MRGIFLTEDTYLGDIMNPLTLNRYSYCIGNPLFYSDPSGHRLYHYNVTDNVKKQIEEDFLNEMKGSRLHEYQLYELYEERVNAYKGLNYTGFWDAIWFSEEEQRISYMVNLDYGNPSHRQFIKTAAETAKIRAEAKKCLEEKEALRLYGNANQCKDINGNYPVKVDSWMKLYGAPTVAVEGRPVARSDGANMFDWGMPEPKENINKEARDQIVRNGGIYVINKYNEQNANIFTDQEGRYWVAVGPRVADEHADLTVKLMADKYVYGTKMDIHVKDKMGIEYYIPAVLGDLREHSGPDGLFQTGIEIPTGKKAEGYDDGSMVEFLGDNILEEMVGNKSKSLVNRSNNYEILEIIMYDNVLNY